MSKRVLLCLVLVASLFFSVGVVEAGEPTVCVVYFRSVDCPAPACFTTDPFVLVELPREYGGKFVVIEYEISQDPENAGVMAEYNATYGSGLTTPLIIFGVDGFLVEDMTILDELRSKVDEHLALGGNELPLANGSSVAFEDLNVEDLPGFPKVWTGGQKSPTLLVVLAAAAVDALNPCAFAVLVVLLSGVIASGGRKKALKAGLAFIIAVFVMYLLIGFGIFSIITTRETTDIFYKTVGVFALVVGMLNVKDYFWESAMGVLSTVPRSWRPRVQKLLDDATSVLGALVSGFAVSLFLLPCTSGPYVVVLGLLAHETTKMYATQLILLYNFIFVLPMIGIVLAVYFGLTTTAKAARWRHRRIRLLHLIAGVVMFCMGIWMLFFY